MASITTEKTIKLITCNLYLPNTGSQRHWYKKMDHNLFQMSLLSLCTKMVKNRIKGTPRRTETSTPANVRLLNTLLIRVYNHPIKECQPFINNCFGRSLKLSRNQDSQWEALLILQFQHFFH